MTDVGRLAGAYSLGDIFDKDGGAAPIPTDPRRKEMFDIVVMAFMARGWTFTEEDIEWEGETVRGVVAHRPPGGPTF